MPTSVRASEGWRVMVVLLSGSGESELAVAMGSHVDSGAPELGGYGGGEQGGVGADGHERPALGQPHRRRGAVVDEQPAGFAISLRRGADLAERCYETIGPDVPRHAEVVAEVARPDEEHIGA